MQRSKPRGRITLLSCGAVWMLAVVGTAQASYPITGVNPHQRPEGAPVITQDAHGPVWFQRALHGVSEPYPMSLLFLRHQGNWYTPFIQPGMPGYYDLRGWHPVR